MRSNIVVGLDIGTTKIAAIVARKNEHGKIEILGYGNTPSAGVMRGSVMNIDKTVESIKIAVEEAELRSGVKIKEVYVGIAGQHIRSFQRSGEKIRTKEEEITQAEVDEFITLMEKIQVEPGEQILHVIPQEFIVDKVHGIKDPVGMWGRELSANFHIITGQASSIKNIRRSVEKAGLVVKDLVLEPLASASAVVDDKDCLAGVALLDIGGGTTDIAIYHDQVLRHTAVIPLGGNIITDDIQIGCKIIEQQARKLKEDFGFALADANKENVIITIPGLRGRPPKEISQKNLSGIIQARMEDILDCALFEIHASGYDKKLIAGIVLTGGGAMLKYISQLTEFKTHIDTRIGYPNEHLSSNNNDVVAHPIFSTSIGLVIWGLEKEEPFVAEPEETAVPEPAEETPQSKPTTKKINKKASISKNKSKIPFSLKNVMSFIDNILKDDGIS